MLGDRLGDQCLAVRPTVGDQPVGLGLGLGEQSLGPGLGSGDEVVALAAADQGAEAEAEADRLALLDSQGDDVNASEQRVELIRKTT